MTAELYVHRGLVLEGVRMHICKKEKRNLKINKDDVLHFIVLCAHLQQKV